jgi:tetratricopeptide (TPR) repeat protein
MRSLDARGDRRPIVQVLRRNLAKALSERSLEAAGDLLEQLRAEDPFAVETRGLELELLILSGRLAEAEGLARQLLVLFPSSARVWKLGGELAYRRKDYRVAEERLRESDRIHPHWETRRLLGRTLTQAGRFGDAEAVLVALAAEREVCGKDLAWVYERKGEEDRALACVEAYLERFPRDRVALDQRLRLRARRLSPEELQGEAGALEAIGEKVPTEVAAELVGTLLRSGRPREARETVDRLLPDLDPRAASRIGWVCRALEAHDLAFDLFRRAFPRERDNHKFLATFELVAKRCGRLHELLALYRAHARESPNLYGRAKRLQGMLEGGRHG